MTGHANRGRTAKTLGRNDRLLGMQRREQHGTAALSERVAAPLPEAVRRHIDAATCPFCGRGPYKVLAVHTNKIHGVDKYELRDMAGLSTKDRITTKEFVENARRKALEHHLGTSPETDAGRRRRDKKPARLTELGKARLTANLESFNQTATSEQRAAISRAAHQKRQS